MGGGADLIRQGILQASNSGGLYGGSVSEQMENEREIYFT